VQFRKWIKSTAGETGGIVIAEADPLITTWSDFDRETFFREFLQTELRKSDGGKAAAILVSNLAARYEFTDKERGQGIVVHVTRSQ